MTKRKRVEYVTNITSGLEFIHSTGSLVDIAPHTHITTHIILLVRSGEIHITTASGVLFLHAGSYLALPPHSVHGLRAVSHHSLLSLCIDVSMLERSRHQIIVFLNELVNNGQLLQVEKELFTKALGNLKPRTEEPKDSLRSLKEALVAAPDQDITLADMAEHAHINKYHLIRAFKKRYGLTPYGFLMQNRIRKARTLMSKNNTMTKTALQAGFFDQSHFIRHFKRLHGLTPRQFLKSQGHIPNKN